MTKVVILSTEYPPTHGGIGVVAKNIKDNLESSLVICEGGKSTDDHQDVIRIRKSRSKLRYALMLFEVMKQITPGKETYIIANCLISQRVCFILSFLYKIRYVNICHGTDLNANMCGKRSLVYKYIYSRSVGNFCVSDYVCQLFTEYTNLKPIRFKLGISNEERAKQIAENKVYRKNQIVTVCRLDQRKGLDTILEAIVSLKDDFEQLGWKYVLAGNGPKFNEINNFIQKNNLTDIIELKGNISEDDKYNILNESKLFLMHSIKDDKKIEGYGISYIEAHVMGCDVFGTGHGGAGEAVRDSKGTIIRDNDITQLKMEILSYISKGFRREKGLLDPNIVGNWSLSVNLIKRKLFDEN